MAFSTVAGKAVGDQFTEAMWDASIAENLNWLHGEGTAQTVIDVNLPHQIATHTVTTSRPWQMLQTWNAGAQTFTAFKVNVTDSASATASLLADFQVGGSSKFSIGKDGSAAAAGNVAVGTSALPSVGLFIAPTLTTNATQSGVNSQPTYNATATAGYSLYAYGTTANSAFTLATMAGLFVDTLIKGAAATVTSAYGVYVKSQTVGGSNNYGVVIEAPVGGASNTVGLYNMGTTRLDGTAYIGDTSNAFATLGLTLNQGAADDEILALKSSDVAHGITDLAETDTYGQVLKASSTAGGLFLRGLSEDTNGLRFNSVHTNDTTTKSAVATASITLQAHVKNSTGTANPGADANLLAILGGSATRFIFDQEGSAHADVEWTTFDTHDDVALLDALEHEMDPALRRDPVRDAFGQVLRYGRDQLQAARIVNFYDDGPRAMVNFTRLAMLHTGAIRQVYDRLAAVTAELATLKQHPALAGA